MRWIGRCLYNYATFTGRAQRIEFWLFASLFVILTTVAGRVDQLVGEPVTVALRMGMMELVVTLMLILPLVSVCARRLHDTDRSGWWMLLMYAPYLGWLVSQDGSRRELLSLGAFVLGFVALVILLALPGSPDQNRFGKPPAA
jgi:uncharacterized membrane protein YhaH (DUF805 family)